MVKTPKTHLILIFNICNDPNNKIPGEKKSKLNFIYDVKNAYFFAS